MVPRGKSVGLCVSPLGGSGALETRLSSWANLPKKRVAWCLCFRFRRAPKGALPMAAAGNEGTLEAQNGQVRDSGRRGIAQHRAGS